MSPRFGGGGRDSGGEERARSAEAREQARREREARRAAREGRPPADLPPREPAAPREPEPEPVAPPEPAWHAEPGDFLADPAADAVPFADEEQPWQPAAADPVPAPEPAWREPEPAAYEEPPYVAPAEPVDLPEDEPYAEEPPPPAPAPRQPIIPPRPALSWEADEPTRVDPPAPADPPRRAEPPARPDVDFGFDDVSADDEPAVRVLGNDDDPDRPAGVKRVAASAFATAAGADGPPRFGAPPKGRGTPRSRRGVRRVGPVILIVVLLALAYGANTFWQPFHGDGTGTVRVVIPDGSGARQIGDQLAEAGVVDNGLIFSLRARFSGDRDKLRSGPHTLKRDMSYEDAIAALMIVPTEVPTLDVAIPEGLTIKQVGSVAHRAELKGSYRKAARSASVLRRIRTLGAPARVKTPEGFLFPATYRLRTTASTADLITQQLRTFRRETAKIDYAYAKSKNLSRYDVLIIASLIENEAQTAEDRPLIAGVIYNRLKAGMPLQIDATTRYETENYGEDARPIRQSELDADTPYNTRIKQGLPPTPISSPGLASLRAAARPSKKPFIYYVVKPCGDGAHNFSASAEKFARDRDAYDAKRAELGGKDPSSC